jgi:uncharacterized protein YjbI with pentapeptide repeats
MIGSCARRYGAVSNFKHVDMLKQGVGSWNNCRSSDIDFKPNLSEANLIQANLIRINFRQADLRKADLRKANLGQADLFKADLRNANLRGANLVEADLRGANLSGANFFAADLSKAKLNAADLRRTNLCEADLYETDLSEANLSEAMLKNAQMLSSNLENANLRSANLSDAVLTMAHLVNADLSMAVVSGAKLFGTTRDDWKIDGIKCDYIYWDGPGKTRTPAKGNFKPGEFELLYRQLPTIEFVFQQAFSPLNALLMDRVVKTINQEKPEFELSLDSLIVRGIPRAVFSVLHKEHCDQALSLINAQYLAHLKLIESKFDTLSACCQQMTDRLDWNYRVPN